MLRRLILLASAVVLFGLSASAASGDDDRPEPAPGLPFMECIGFPSVPCTGGPNDPISNNFGWTNAAQLGLAGSVPAKQWARIPLSMVAAVSEFGFDAYDGPWASNQTIDLRIRAFFTSPAGSKDNYGYSPVIPIRTVAFGSIPTEITLQVRQERDANDKPVPLRFVDRSRSINFPEDRPDLAAIDSIEPLLEPLAATVEVRVLKLKVDGVDLGLVPGCSTGTRASLNLTNTPVSVETPRGSEVNDPLLAVTNPDDHFYGASGGSLHGTIDIPAFRHCSTSTGDDIAPLLTSAVSGDGNPVTAKIGTIACVVLSDDGSRILPNQPGVVSPYDPRSGCNTGSSNGRFTNVPSAIPFPDHAPGEPDD